MASAGAFPGTEQAQERAVEPFDRAEEGERGQRRLRELETDTFGQRKNPLGWARLDWMWVINGSVHLASAYT